MNYTERTLIAFLKAELKTCEYRARPRLQRIVRAIESGSYLNPRGSRIPLDGAPTVTV